MTIIEEIKVYADLLRAWKEAHKKIPSIPFPTPPRCLELDMNRDGRWSPKELDSMVKEGYWDHLRIIVFKEKYGERHYIIREPKDYGRVALDIIKSRREAGWFEYRPEHEDHPRNPLVKPKTTLEEAALMDREVKEIVEVMWRQYNGGLKENERVKENFRLLRLALDGDAIAAVKFLCKRRAFQYEEYDIITPIDLTPEPEE